MEMIFHSHANKTPQYESEGFLELESGLLF